MTKSEIDRIFHLMDRLRQCANQAPGHSYKTNAGDFGIFDDAADAINLLIERNTVAEDSVTVSEMMEAIDTAGAAMRAVLATGDKELHRFVLSRFASSMGVPMVEELPE